MPGPGAYRIERIQVRSPRLPRQPFGKARRFRTADRDSALLDVARLAPPNPANAINLRPALGEQVVSHLETRPRVYFGRGTREAANITCTRTGRAGMDSPGPIYHPGTTSRELESRLGIRPTFSPRARINKLIRDSSELAGTRRSRATSQRRPSTSSSLARTSIGRRVLAETKKDVGYNRPGTSFGRSRRPPLNGPDGAIPGPKYGINARYISTIRRAATPHFGSSTRDQRRRTRGVVDERPRGKNGAPGPAAYFPHGDASVQMAERRTMKGFGPSFSMGKRTSSLNRPDGVRGKRTGKGSSNTYLEFEPDLHKLSSLEYTSSMGDQLEGPKKSSPRAKFSISPRFGPASGFMGGGR